MNYIFNYHFAPVGQGLFACGCIYRSNEPDPCFAWVYDCGTTSRKVFVDRAIDHLEQRFAARKCLDLVTLSHFDDDHISGVCQLIQRFKIGTLLLPYMELRQRLILAFENGTSPNDNLMDFFLNPVDYLANLDGPGIDRILFVRASGNDGPILPEGSVNTPDDSGDFPRLEFKIERPEDSKDYQAFDAAAEQAQSKTRVEFLRKSTAILLPNLWEFVPYNDDPEEKISKEFEAEVKIERDQLLNSNSKRSRNNALRRLKRIYDNEFGGSPYKRNVISLFLYSGPIYASWRHTLLGNMWQVRFHRPMIWRRLWRGMRRLGEKKKCSVLYTGDGYLNRTKRLNRFTDYLQKDRIDRVGVFQVMHHGAKANWRRGVAAKISPLLSVFSSDPEHKGCGHPHAAVLRDFWGYGPVQVDKRTDFTCSGGLIR